MPKDDRCPDVSLFTYHEQTRRKTSLMPTASRTDTFLQGQERPRVNSATIMSVIEPPSRRRVLSLAHHTSIPSRKVTFKNMYTPDVVPPPKVVSYDELVFNVAGLFHTMSFLHDPEDWDDNPVSEDESYDPEPPLERSVPLMIAEFFYRSAMYLGHPPGETPWLPGFREDKKFSANDVKRWRRLAHFDWEAEEQEFLQNHRKPPPLKSLASRDERSESVESNGNTSVMSTIGTSFRMHQHENVDSMSSKSSQQNQESQLSRKAKFYVAKWLRKNRRPSDVDGSKDESGKHKPVSWLNPPPISSARNLKLLVDIVNSCVYCGQYQFRRRDIVRLCNVQI